MNTEIFGGHGPEKKVESQVQWLRKKNQGHGDKLFWKLLQPTFYFFTVGHTEYSQISVDLQKIREFTKKKKKI